AFSSVLRDGSASTASNTVTVAPSACSDAIAGSQRPSLRRPGSVTKSTAGPSLRPASAPKRRAAPGSKITDGVVLKVNGAKAWFSMFSKLTRARRFVESEPGLRQAQRIGKPETAMLDVLT